MKLSGFLNGVEITFDFIPPNSFVGVIPKQLNGKYIVQMSVVDDAGNVTNYSNIFVLIDFSSLTFKVLDKQHPFVQNGENFGYFEKESKFSSQENNNLVFKELVSEFTTKEIKGGCHNGSE